LIGGLLILKSEAVNMDRLRDMAIMAEKTEANLKRNIEVRIPINAINTSNNMIEVFMVLLQRYLYE
jgi:hypothetical protein